MVRQGKPACPDDAIVRLFCPTGQEICGFSEMACSNNKLRRDDDSLKYHCALSP
jgi:hypothetical protein